MNAPLFVAILDAPFIAAVYPDKHRFVHPKHTSRLARNYMAENNINWWKTPAESPDCNPIENLWHEAKEFLRREIKPKTKQELIDGILSFWKTVPRVAAIEGFHCVCVCGCVCGCGRVGGGFCSTITSTVSKYKKCCQKSSN